MAQCLSFIGNLITQLCSLVLPWGVSFGVVVVGVLTAPMIVSAIKKIF